MTGGLQPHHVTLCALLRLYLDPEALVARLTPELYQRAGDLLLDLIGASDTISFPSLPQLLSRLEVRPQTRHTGVCLFFLSCMFPSCMF